eukprot:72621-Pelagomonas_calceolata.AAC.3
MVLPPSTRYIHTGAGRFPGCVGMQVAASSSRPPRRHYWLRAEPNKAQFDVKQYASFILGCKEQPAHQEDLSG